MMSNTASLLPFDPPLVLEAKRRTGLVLLPEASQEAEAKPNPLDLSWNASWSRVDDSAACPPSLTRRSSLNGNILQVGDRACAHGAPQLLYFMQRKIGKTQFGSVRVGFRLNANATASAAHDDTDGGEDSNDAMEKLMSTEYNVVRSPSGPYPFEMVAIKVYDRKLWSAYESELSALQMMNGAGFVEYSHAIGQDRRDNVYVIVPFHGEGTLFEYAVECGTLTEPVARHYFTQILKALQTLQSHDLCHRNISLDNIQLRGTDCALTELGSCLRVSSASEPLLPPHHATGSNPHYICPEVIRTESFSPFAADLWAAGICLAKLLLGTELFVWASEEDKRFVHVSVEGNLKQWVLSSPSTPSSSPPSLSEEAFDLMQGMLHAKPCDRLTLHQCLHHPWLQGETMPPQFSTNIVDDN